MAPVTAQMEQLYDKEGVKKKDAYVLMDECIFDGYYALFFSLQISNECFQKGDSAELQRRLTFHIYVG